MLSASGHNCKPRLRSQKLAIGEISAEITGKDAADTLRLVLHDAGTYDINTGTGGINGSIVLKYTIPLHSLCNADTAPHLCHTFQHV